MKNKKSIAILMAAITLASCQSYKKVPYLQSYESLTDKSYKEIVINEVNQQDTLYDARIQPKDLLNITINTTDPQAAAPFNLTMQTYNNIAQSNASTTSQPALQQYLVDNAGEIDFPVSRMRRTISKPSMHFFIISLCKILLHCMHRKL